MIVLVFGARGWIGQQFVQLVEEKYRGISLVVAKTRPENKESLLREVTQVQPTHIVSFIGRTHGGGIDTIDYLEQPGKMTENVRDNLQAPKNLAELCEEKQIHFTYLGTGCIFTYDQDHPYGDCSRGFTETDKPNFFGSSYSVVKGCTDQLMNTYENTLNLRIRMPITSTDNKRNFITKITNYEFICSMQNSMTVLSSVLPCIVDMMAKRTTGTINLTNPGCISHDEILQLYKDIVDPEFSWKNFSLEDQDKVLKSKRSNNCLNTSRLEALFPEIETIRDAVTRTLHEMKDARKHRVVLVTGGAGFIGSNFINEYCRNNPTHDVINMDALYYCANKDNVVEEVRKSQHYYFCNVNLRNFEAVRAVVQRYPITHVVHFAAQSHVQNSFSESLEYTQDNVVGTHNLLEALRLDRLQTLRRFIHVSTDEVYGESSFDNTEESLKNEQSVACPTNPYAASKAAAEMLVLSYRTSYKFPVIITRGNNVYGPNQYPEKLIPKFIMLAKAGKSLTIQGDGSNVRGFLHVRDVVSAFVTLLDKGELGEIYNIGCDEDNEFTVMEVARKISRLVNGDQEITIEFIADRPFNDKRYFISSEKILGLGWKPTVSFDDGLRELVSS